MSEKNQLVETFTEKAKLTSAFVEHVKNMEEAFAYALDVCGKKGPCRKLLPDGDASAAAGADGKPQKIIAAPGFPAAESEAFGAQAAARGMRFITTGLRDHLGGVDVGFTLADAGIAETGTLILDSHSEDLRLATMICETHVCVLRIADIRATSFDAEPVLRAMSRKAPAYVAFVSGASRTSDIERVLALGVHGPLELHILLWED